MVQVLNQNVYKRLVFQSIENALSELNAEDKGHYYICNCPECNQHEAFMYKNNINYIQCNRENHCGERMMLQYHDKNNQAHYKKEDMQTKNKSFTRKQQEALTWITRLFSYAKKYIPSSTLDHGYRGISKEVSRKHIVDLQKEELVQLFFQQASVLLNKNYETNDWMCRRNLVFPLYGDGHTPDRVLFRSSIDPNLEPKEIQLIMNPSKETRDFFVDVSKDARTIVFSESIIDALSFREVDKACGFIALTGASKTRKVADYIQNNRDIFENKQLLLAMDDDPAGWKATQKLVEVLDNTGLRANYDLLNYDLAHKDGNEFLQGNRALFKERYLHKTNQLSKEKDREMEMP